MADRSRGLGSPTATSSIPATRTRQLGGLQVAKMGPGQLTGLLANGLSTATGQVRAAGPPGVAYLGGIRATGQSTAYGQSHIPGAARVAGYPSLSLYPSPDLYPGAVSGPSPPPVTPPLPPVGYVGATGVLMLLDHHGNGVSELRVDHNIRFERDTPVSVKFFIGYDEAGCGELLDMLTPGSGSAQMPQLAAYRNGALIFRGWWAPQSEAADGSEQDGLTCEFRSPMAQLETRYRFFPVTYTALQAGEIAMRLLDDTNDVGKTGCERGTWEASVTRTRKYESGQQLSAAIDDITKKNLVDGFHWKEAFYRPDDRPDTLSALHVHYPNLGTDISANTVFAFGRRTTNNVISFERTLGPPINRSIGKDGSTPPNVVEIDDQASQDKWGVYMVFNEWTDMKDDLEHLNNRTRAQLSPDPIEEVTFVPDSLMTPTPFDDYYIGDTVHFYAKQGDIFIDSDVTIAAMELARDGNGFETGHTLEFGAQVDQPLVPRRHTRKVVLKSPNRGGRGAKHPHPPTRRKTSTHRR